MADLISPGGSDTLEETLGRLSKKTGVKASIILDRSSGAILKTSGQISSLRSARSASATSNNSSSLPGQSQTTGSFSAEAGAAQTGTGENQGTEQLAAMVWRFVSSAGVLVQEMDAEDELKLLRLRTKKQELVIVPDAKYLLVVIHDTPPA